VVQKRLSEPGLIPNFPKSHRYWQLSSPNRSFFRKKCLSSQEPWNCMPTARFVGSHPLRPERPAIGGRWKMWASCQVLGKNTLEIQWSIFYEPMNHKSKTRSLLISAISWRFLEPIWREEYPYFPYTYRYIIQGSHERWRHLSLRACFLQKENTWYTQPFPIFETLKIEMKKMVVIFWYGEVWKVSNYFSTFSPLSWVGHCSELTGEPWFWNSW